MNDILDGLHAGAPSLRALLARVNDAPGKHAGRYSDEVNRPDDGYVPRHYAPEDES